jgi:hypothetical protein
MPLAAKTKAASGKNPGRRRQKPRVSRVGHGGDQDVHRRKLIFDTAKSYLVVVSWVASTGFGFGTTGLLRGWRRRLAVMGNPW